MGVSNGAQNKDVSNPKSYHYIEVESNFSPWFTHFRCEYPIEMSSDLVEDNYNESEGIFASPIFRNRLTPDIDGYDLALNFGEKMRAAAMLYMLEFAPVDIPAQIKFVNIGYVPSLGHSS